MSSRIGKPAELDGREVVALAKVYCTRSQTEVLYDGPPRPSRTAIPERRPRRAIVQVSADCDRVEYTCRNRPWCACHPRRDPGLTRPFRDPILRSKRLCRLFHHSDRSWRASRKRRRRLQKIAHNPHRRCNPHERTSSSRSAAEQMERTIQPANLRPMLGKSYAPEAELGTNDIDSSHCRGHNCACHRNSRSFRAITNNVSGVSGTGIEIGGAGG